MTTRKAVIKDEWYDLFDEFEPIWAYNLFLGHIQHHILQSFPIVVPSLPESVFFSLGNLVIKQKQKLVEKLGKNTPVYSVLGNVREFLASGDAETLGKLQGCIDFPLELVDDDIEPYSCEVEKSVKQLKKSVELECKFPDKFALPIELIKTFHLDPVKFDKVPEKVYFIDEIMITPRLRFIMRIGDDTKRFQFSKIPIGFSMVSFELNQKTGKLESVLKKHTGLNFEGHWEYPKATPTSVSFMNESIRSNISSKSLAPQVPKRIEKFAGGTTNEMGAASPRVSAFYSPYDEKAEELDKTMEIFNRATNQLTRVSHLKAHLSLQTTPGQRQPVSRLSTVSSYSAASGTWQLGSTPDRVKQDFLNAINESPTQFSTTRAPRKQYNSPDLYLSPQISDDGSDHTPSSASRSSYRKAMEALSQEEEEGASPSK